MIIKRNLGKALVVEPVDSANALARGELLVNLALVTPALATPVLVTPVLVTRALVAPILVIPALVTADVVTPVLVTPLSLVLRPLQLGTRPHFCAPLLRTPYT